MKARQRYYERVSFTVSVNRSLVDRTAPYMVTIVEHLDDGEPKVVAQTPMSTTRFRHWLEELAPQLFRAMFIDLVTSRWGAALSNLPVFDDAKGAEPQLPRG